MGSQGVGQGGAGGQYGPSLVSIASHELRTPMTTIVGFSELLLTRNPPESTRRDWLQRINSDDHRLINVVDDVLNVSLIHSGELSIQRGGLTVTIRWLKTQSCLSAP